MDDLSKLVGGRELVARAALSVVKQVVPAVGTALDLFKDVQTYRDQVFVKKLAKFIDTLDGLTPEAVERVRKCAAADPQQMREIGDLVLLAIDQSLDFDKPALHARLFFAFADGLISRDEFGRLVAAVARGHTGDLHRFAAMDRSSTGDWKLGVEPGSILASIGFATGTTIGGQSSMFVVTREGDLFYATMKKVDESMARARDAD